MTNLYAITKLSPNSFKNMYNYTIREQKLTNSPPPELFRAERVMRGKILTTDLIGHFKTQAKAYKEVITDAKKRRDKLIDVRLYVDGDAEVLLYAGEK